MSGRPLWTFKLPVFNRESKPQKSLSWFTIADSKKQYIYLVYQAVNVLLKLCGKHMLDFEQHYCIKFDHEYNCNLNLHVLDQWRVCKHSTSKC